MVALDVNVVILAVDEEETELGDSLKAQVVSKNVPNHRQREVHGNEENAGKNGPI